MSNRQPRNLCWKETAFVTPCAQYFAIILVAFWISGCSPSDSTPGQWLRGNAVDAVPQDWSFTDEFKEIYVEVKTPYFIPHSVTIWCAQVDGKLFIGARDPESKNWPGWLDKNRDLRLKVGDNVYSLAASPLADDATLARVRTAYAEKYELPAPTDDKPSNMRYWAIVLRNL